MRISVQSEHVGKSLANDALEDLSAFINKHVAAQGSHVQLALPPVGIGDDGIWTIAVTVEFAQATHAPFLRKS